MRKLSNKKINILCDIIIEDVYKAQRSYSTIFLCCEITKYLGCYTNNITKKIPLFNYENAKIHADADNHGGFSFWWVYSENLSTGRYYDEAYLNRIKFLEWIKSQYPVKESPFKNWLQKLINFN
jgi:hypothetical protein